MDRARLAAGLFVFSIVYTLVYTAAYYNQWSVFVFYPLVGEFHLTIQPRALGPGMMYYGWIVLAGVVGLAVAAVIPSRYVLRLWAGWAWVIPLGATLFTLIYETRWFLR